MAAGYLWPMGELVSIALCTYNSGKFLEPLLDSLVNQAWRPLEIVCCDDRSTDETVTILEKYFRENPGMFRVHVNEYNLGYIRNFEKCLSLCSGEYIAIADHDDIWDPSKIELLKSKIGDALMVYSDSRLINEDGTDLHKKISDDFRLHDKPAPEAFSFYDFIWGHTTLVRKKLLEYALPIPGEMPYDSWLAFTAASVSAVRYVDKPLTAWRQHGESYSALMFDRNADRKKKPGWQWHEFQEKKQRLKWLMEHDHGDNFFMKTLHDHYALLEKGFSWKLFFFLATHHKKLFPIWRRNYFSRLNEFRKMARGVKPVSNI